MNNPKIVAPVSGAVAAYLLYSMLNASEAPSSALNALSWAFFILALVACIGSLYRIMKGG